MRILVFATLLTIMPAAHGSGFAQTAGELVEVCKSVEPSRKAFCLGYILGFADGHHLVTSDLANLKVVIFCLPENWTAGQGEAVFIRWAEDNPDKWHLGKRYAVSLSFAGAFPCQ